MKPFSVMLAVILWIVVPLLAWAFVLYGLQAITR
jgi:hypothetical protein